MSKHKERMIDDSCYVSKVVLFSNMFNLGSNIYQDRILKKCFKTLKTRIPYSLKFLRPFYFRAFNFRASNFRAPPKFHFSRPPNFRASYPFRTPFIFAHPKFSTRSIIFQYFAHSNIFFNKIKIFLGNLFVNSRINAFFPMRKYISHFPQ